ncbi:hypothetical protein ElyMa_001776400 [Elysia marginata]|uniref:Uncharacterized protein n=1 Tax=Elysia marginata TaxID=1093978 RepID=A0AAV4EDL6_9GAST|nr:hypothetical protein ElyMa_001776400 [Elysia marginata]
MKREWYRHNSGVRIQVRSPRIELLEVTSTAFCNDNFQLAGQDYTVLKYNITGMNSEYKMESFVDPWLTESETYNTFCSPIDSYTGACSHRQFGVQDCRCDQISDKEYHFTYNRTADPDISNVTVFMHWSSRRGVIDSDHYTFKPVVTDESLCGTREHSHETTLSQASGLLAPTSAETPSALVVPRGKKRKLFREMRIKYLKEEQEVKMQAHRRELEFQMERHRLQMEVLQYQRDYALKKLRGSSCSES